MWGHWRLREGGGKGMQRPASWRVHSRVSLGELRGSVMHKSIRSMKYKGGIVCALRINSNEVIHKE